MNKIVCFLCLFAVLCLSCKETDLSGLENEIENLQENIDNLQNVIALQASFQAKKNIVSASHKAVSVETGEAGSWTLTFSDNTIVRLPDTIVTSVVKDAEKEEYNILLTDGQSFVFNHKEAVYPTGIVVITPSIAFMKNAEVAIDFRVNPSNAIFNYDVSSEDCQIAIDAADKISTYSYVTLPDRFHITRIEKKDEGQYRAYIKDNGYYEQYKFAAALVLSISDYEGKTIQLSSATIPLERKKDTSFPVVVIHTEDEAEIVDKENWIPASMTIDGIGKFPDYEGSITIRGRGNSTWDYPKKPFAIKLDEKEELLGMPKHKRWVLLANYMDRTLMRNYVAFQIARCTGLDWTPRGQFVEVMLNDKHLGSYFLCEQIKIDENRVNISELEPSDKEGDVITGGYLLEMDSHYDEVNKFRSALFDLPVMIKEPDEDDICPEQFAYIQNYIDSIETLLSENNYAITRRYAEMIDDTTFIDFWLVQELACNSEPMHPNSCYFYKDRGGKLKAGPVWDFDWETFKEKSGFCAKETIWYGKLFEDPEFVRKVKERWTMFKPSFEAISDTIISIGGRLKTSAELNDAMWSLNNKESINGDEKLAFINAVNLLKSNYVNRINWLDNKINNMR